MCGIIGVAIRKKCGMDVARSMFKIWRNQATRGNDGAGISVLSKGKLRRVRDVCPSSLFSVMYYKFWRKLGVGDCVIFHHRFPTSGGKGDVLRANHPVANESGDLHLVHNGSIFNTLYLMDKLKENGHKFETVVNEGEVGEDITDSEVLVHLLEDDKDLKKAVKFMDSRVNGSLAIGFLRGGDNKIWLFRRNNPIKIFEDRHGNIFFASEKPKKEFKTLSSVDSGVLYNISKDGVVRISKKRGRKKRGECKNYNNKYNWSDIKKDGVFEGNDWAGFDEDGVWVGGGYRP